MKGLRTLLLPLLFHLTMATGQGCIRTYVDGKWESFGNCLTSDDLERVFAQINSAAKEEKNIEEVKSESDKCQGKSLKNITVKFSNATTSNLRASASGGWTVFQRRQDGSVNFTRNWVEYVNGFGDPCGEYWLGLEAIYQLTKNGDQMLRIDMIENGTGTHYYAQYSNFQIEPVSDNYRLSLSGYSGNATNALTPDVPKYGWTTADGMAFSTFEADHDRADKINCAAQSGGGWWHNACSIARPNGRYTGKGLQGVTWQNMDTGERPQLKFVEMKIKKRS